MAASIGEDVLVSKNFEESDVDNSSLSEGIHREMFVQFAESVVDFSSQYGSEGSMSYSASNLTGKPSVFSYGDSPWAFVLGGGHIYRWSILVYLIIQMMRTFGPWCEGVSSASRPFKEQSHHKCFSQDFIELTFEQKVYPIKLDIYETYNPGSVTKVMACSCTTFTWATLWSSEQCELNLPAKSRIFSPPLKDVGFLTDMIRLEFHHRHLSYYAQLAAVQLTGSLELAQPSIISSSTDVLAYHPPRHHLSDMSGLNAVSSRIESLSFTVRPSSHFHPVLVCETGGFYATCGHCSRKNHLESLPSEVIHLIVSYLDLSSLCRLACTSRLMQRQCYDPLLYSELDLQPYWHKVTEEALSGLKSRCPSVQRLRLTWCGNHGRLSSSSVANFVGACGRHLTCVHLANCKFVDNDFLGALAESAPQLEDLDLQNCQQSILDHKSFLQITKFTNLRCLNLYRTLIELLPLLVILRCCQKLEFLNLGSCSAISSFDDVAFEIGRRCRSIKSLILWRAKSLSAVGVKFIADNCHILEELDLGWCVEVLSNTGCLLNLAERCPCLQRIYLTALRTVCDSDLLAFARCCPNLEQLDILGTREVGAASCGRLLSTCQNLRFFDVSFCEKIDSLTVQLWRQDFPKVKICKSVQSNSSFV